MKWQTVSTVESYKEFELALLTPSSEVGIIMSRIRGSIAE